MPDATENFFAQLAQREHDPRLDITSATIRFDIVQDGQTENWFVRHDSGRVDVSRESGEADATVRADRAVFNAIASGHTYLIAAILRGEVIIQGEPIVLIAIKRLFPERHGQTRPRGRSAGLARRRTAVSQDLVTILDGDTFVAGNASGDISALPAQPVGLFYRHTRLLSTWILTINGQRLMPLSVDMVSHYEVRFFLILTETEGAAATTLSVVRERTVCDGLCETLTLLNHDDKPVDLTVRMETGSDFADFEEIRGAINKEGHCYHEVGAGQLLLGYQRELFSRETLIAAPEPAQFDEHGFTIEVHIDPQGSWSTKFEAFPRHGIVPHEAERLARSRRSTSEMEADLQRWLDAAPRMECAWDPLADIYQRSLVDLASLRRPADPEGSARGRGIDPTFVYLSAGLPWFMTRFGRDTIIASLQALPFGPQLARATLFLLGAWQGSHRDDFRDEDPGRIMDEMALGEMCVFEERPHTPSFASADSTPLFVVLLDEYHRWTGDTELVRKLEYEATAALNWIDGYADLAGNGYISYQPRNDYAPKNQCWKNSPEAICYRDGRLPGFPRATAELQGYAYDAKMRGARLARQVWNNPSYADRLEREANDLKRRFDRDFWLEDRQYFALALDGNGGRVDALASNMGHLLWSGIVEPDKARAVADHLMSERLFSGWGVRTLADGEIRYNPVGYHTGAVWPFDNSLIAWGLRRYGYDEEAARIAAGLLDAAVIFGGRLPETFCGYPRAQTRYPVAYPTACSPYATSAGAPLLLLRTMLGLESVGDKLVFKPALPVNLGGLRLLDIPGRWGHADAYGRGPIEAGRRQGLHPQLGPADSGAARQMPGY